MFSFKYVLKSILIVLICLFVWFAFIAYQLYIKSVTATTDTIKIFPGTQIEQLATELQVRNWLSYPKTFVFLAEMNGSFAKLRYGEYWVKPGMSVMDILKEIVTGKGLVRHAITFIEGWKFSDIKNELAKDTTVKHTLQNKTDAQIMSMLGAKQKNPEGLFFPDTYFFIWGNTDFSILQKAYNKMQHYTTLAWTKRAKDLNYKSVYQALIVASLIEKETALATERPKIAEVILRRLTLNMRLQIDPTVVYGVGKPFAAPITKEDLASNTPYNTYRVMGLPPTPIVMPSAASIDAALHPDFSNNYLFYVANGMGAHTFSQTYQQHLIAVKKYRSFESEKDNSSKRN